MNRKKIGVTGRTLVLLGMLALTLIVVVVAAIIVKTRVIEQNGLIQGDWDFQLYTDVSLTTVLAQVDWNTINKGMSYQTPEHYIKNIGADPVYVKWNCTDPSGLSFTLKAPDRYPIDPSDWPENEYLLFAAGESTRLKFIVDVAPGAPPGTFNVPITFYGADVEG